MRAARYGNVSPWELDIQHEAWRDRLLMAETAEAEAQAKLNKQAERKRKRGARGT